MTSFILFFYILTIIITLVSLARVFEKSGQAGWKAFIPLYNLFIIVDIIRKPRWWVLLMLIPFFGIIWILWSSVLLARVFGKGSFFALGIMIFPFILFPILAFGKSQYEPSHI